MTDAPAGIHDRLQLLALVLSFGVLAQEVRHVKDVDCSSKITRVLSPSWLRLARITTRVVLIKEGRVGYGVKRRG